MAMSNSFLGYNTHILGTVKTITECLEIILYNSETFEDIGKSLKISLYNIDSVYSDVTKDYYDSYNNVVHHYQKITRESKNVDFEYNGGNSNIEGFDTIIYLSNVDSTPIGYTEFINIQCEKDDVGVSISLDINTDVEEGSLILVNTLSSLQDSNMEKYDIGDELYEYTDFETAKNKINSLNKKEQYATSISQLLHGNSKTNLLGYGALTRLGTDSLKLYELSLNISGNTNPYHLAFTNQSIGYYSGELVLYSWFDSNKFCVTSLSSVNRFGNPIIYTKSTTGYFEVPTFDVLSVNILYGAGRYVVCDVIEDGNSSVRLYDFELQEWSTTDDSNNEVLIDPLDPQGVIITLPKRMTDITLFEYLPEIKSVYMDIKSYSKLYTPKIIKKIGNWYIIRRRYNFDSYLYIAASPTMTLYMTEEDYSKIIIVNDTTIFLNEDSYYLKYEGIGKEYWTERGKVMSGLGDLGTAGFGNISDFIVCVDGRTTSQISDEYTTSVAAKSQPIYKTFLNNYRRQPYPQNLSTLPEIVDAAAGILFYKNEYNINYL